MTQEEIEEADAKRELFASDASTETKAARLRAFANLRAHGVTVESAKRSALTVVHVKEKPNDR